jgi:hypothetical protein
MKTPRDILFARYKNIAPKLDAIRREVLSAEFQIEDQTPFFAKLPLALWRELFWPSRRIWTGLAAIWILISVVNLSQHDKSETMAGKTPLPSPEMMLVFWQQERLLAELTDQKETPIAEPPKPFLPLPRSERRIEILMT